MLEIGAAYAASPVAPKNSTPLPNPVKILFFIVSSPP
jgi:hypothetical protein